jgi:hypothetical protein
VRAREKPEVLPPSLNGSSDFGRNTLNFGVQRETPGRREMAFFAVQSRWILSAFAVISADATRNNQCVPERDHYFRSQLSMDVAVLVLLPSALARRQRPQIDEGRCSSESNLDGFGSPWREYRQMQLGTSSACQ